ncbi:MAG: leucine--tRNA ligase [Patescibacteria group bacterium]|nr:leucine--tRNA ligase [Patescibacteria group bacterium]
MDKYIFKKIEEKWQKFWEKNKIFAAKDFSDKPKYYCLIEFPYPSGEGLHVGHPRSYTALDIIARKRRMQGFNVLYPIGWDAFGLPTENYAIKTGIHPRAATEKNIANFKRQLKSLGLAFDWSREVNTTDPKYYKWTQWMFLKFFEKGLAYKAKMPINWCPSCKIGLANEEVVNGECERCGGQVEKREKEQWMLKITEYAERLLSGLDDVDFWERISKQQTDWIGRSEGAEVEFGIRNQESGIRVFTTRPDTLFGATYMVVAPEHEILRNRELGIRNQEEIREYVEKAKRKSDLERSDLNKEKTGVRLEGVMAVNPVNNEEIPIYVADYVLPGYGTGAIMAVPAHDQRDWEFAKKYGLPIREVVQGGDIKKEAFTGDGIMVNSGFLNGKIVPQAIRDMLQYLEERDLGSREINYKLRDWVFSRQRYWGEPIPIVNCPKCGFVPVAEKDLPVLLPEVKKYQPTDTGESPLAAITDWVRTKCPKCGGEARRETDTMPNWAGSSWYFLRYCDPKNDKAFADMEKLKYWMPVDWYNGGMEHTTLHLLYSRFWNKFLYDEGLVPTDEPYRKRTSHGLILAEGGEKMSKSRGNVVNPDEMVKKYGADVFRLYEMFMGPFDQPVAWDTKGVEGANRFLNKVWNIFSHQIEMIKFYEKRGEKPLHAGEDELVRELHRTVKKVTEDIDEMGFNTAVASLMSFLNKVTAAAGEAKEEDEAWYLLDRDDTQDFLKLLAPFAPHICEELWSRIGHKTSIFESDWPGYNPEFIEFKEIELVIQVNGKIRDRIKVLAGITEDEAKNLALKSEKVLKFLDGKAPKKIIFVAGKLVNIVI